jgi:hypothetical protein
MGFCKVNTRGKKMCLHKRIAYFFSGSEGGAEELPPGYDIVEAKSGLLLLKRKR